MNSSMLKKVIHTFFCVGFLCGLITAEEDTTTANKEKPDSMATLDKMVVTATRTKRLMSQTPASVSVISQEEIEMSPAKNIDDLLMSKTGVQVKRVAGMGEGIPSDIIIRGIPMSFGSSRTLIMVDGIPTNASGTPFLILNEIPLEAIKSIEIVRGPFSSLYGANAFGGAVHVLTRKGYGKPGFEGYFETSYPFTVLNKYAVNERSIRTSLKESGKETYWNIGGVSSGGNEKAHYLVSAGYRTVGNYLMKDYAISKGPYETTRLKNQNYDYRDIRFFGKCGMALGEKGELELHTRFFDSDLGHGKTRQIVPDSSDRVIKGTKFVVGPVVKFALNENINIQGKAYYRTLVGEFWNEEPFGDIYVPGYWKSQQHDWQVESQGIFKIGKAQVITSGIEYLGNFIHFGGKTNTITDSVIPGSDSTDEMITNVAIYLQDEISLFNRLNIVPGLRWDYHSDFGSALSPKIGISYKILDWLRIRNSVGRAFRAPTLSELYMPDLAINADFVLMPNPDLTPEYIWAVDGAVEVMPIPTLKSQIGLFYNDMKDLIGQGPDISNFPNVGVTHFNISDAWSKGIEFEIEWQAIGWLFIYANLVLQKSYDEYANKVIFDIFKRDDYEEASLDYVPRVTSDFGMRLNKDFGTILINATINETFVGERNFLDLTSVVIDPDKPWETIQIIDDVVYVLPNQMPLDPYWRTDIGLKLTYKSFLSFALNIQNLFNAEFEESGGNLAPGRFASIKVGCKF